jgi:hypothetical protein
MIRFLAALATPLVFYKRRKAEMMGCEMIEENL